MEEWERIICYSESWVSLGWIYWADYIIKNDWEIFSLEPAHLNSLIPSLWFSYNHFCQNIKNLAEIANRQTYLKSKLSLKTRTATQKNPFCCYEHSQEHYSWRIWVPALDFGLDKSHQPIKTGWWRSGLKEN